MTAVDGSAKPRIRGNIRRMRDRVQVRVSAGEDPSTGERIILTDSVPIDIPGDARSERAALKNAEKLRIKMLAEADDLKVARTKATVGALLERWMQQHEIDPDHADDLRGADSHLHRAAARRRPPSCCSCVRRVPTGAVLRATA